MAKTSLSLDELKTRVRRLEGGFGDPALRRYVPTGLGALDRVLGGGGLPAASLTAILTAGGSAGEAAWTIAVIFAVAALGPLEGEAVLIDGAGELYPPGLAGLGLRLERTLFVRPARARDSPWAFEEALRSPAVAVAVGAMRRPATAEVRRLELAAEAGGGLGLVLAREAEAGALARVPVVLRVRPRRASASWCGAGPPPARVTAGPAAPLPASGARGPAAPPPLAFGVEVVRSRGRFVAEVKREICVHVAADPVSHDPGSPDGSARAGLARASA